MPVVKYLTINGEIVYENRAGVERAYMRDPAGNVVGLLDDTHTITDTFEYWPYGEVRSRTGTTETPFQFNGARGYFSDAPTGLVYVRSRFLDSPLARWITADPAGADINTFRYASNAPTIFSDQEGRAPQRDAAPALKVSMEPAQVSSDPNYPCDERGRPTNCHGRGYVFCHTCHCKLVECCHCCEDQFGNNRTNQLNCKDNCRNVGGYGKNPAYVCPLVFVVTPI